MQEPVESTPDADLRRIAVDFVLPNGLLVDRAVRVAESLVVSGDAGRATLTVAALPRDALASDAEPLVRDMLSEHGIEVPVVDGKEGQYWILLRAFGYSDLPLHLFEGEFYSRCPAWEDQDPLDRALVVMLDRLERLTAPHEREAIIREMRQEVRQHVPDR